MISGVYRSVLIPGFETALKRRRTFRYWRRTRAQPMANLGRAQDGRPLTLRRLLQHAATNCPFYAASWSALGLAPERIACLEDFRRWPLVNRETVQQCRTDMRSTTDGEKIITKSTGGSKRIPLVLFQIKTAMIDEWRHGIAGTRGLAPHQERVNFTCGESRWVSNRGGFAAKTIFTNRFYTVEKCSTRLVSMTRRSQNICAV